MGQEGRMTPAMRWTALALGTAAVIGLVYLVYSGATSVISSMSVEPGSAPAPSAAPPAPPPPRPAPAIAPQPPQPPRNTARAATSAASAEPVRALSRVAASDRSLRRELNAGLADSRARLASCPDSAGAEISG